MPHHDLGRSAPIQLVKDVPREQPLSVQFDELTGCLSYAGLVETLQRELDRCSRLGLDLTCGLLALDGCRDRDRRLAAVGTALRTIVDTDDAIGHFDRDQFVVLMPGTDADGGLLRMELMCLAVRAIDTRLRPHVGIARAGGHTSAAWLLGDAYRASCAAAAGRSDRVARG